MKLTSLDNLRRRVQSLEESLLPTGEAKTIRVQFVDSNGESDPSKDWVVHVPAGPPKLRRRWKRRF